MRQDLSVKRFTLIRQKGPILQPQVLQDTKDPCPVFDGRQWHMFGSVGSSTVERWHIFHAVAPEIEGPWTELPPSELIGVQGDHVAAPGLWWDGAWMHMFVQTDHAALGGKIEHLVSDDAGRTFTWIDTALASAPELGEATIYDPHPAEIEGVRYIVYSGGAKVGAPDIHLACSASGSWHGPWRRLGPILRHEDVPHHNVRDQPGYEWGLEGPQLVPLPDGTVLLNAVCFLPNREAGTRQRVFFAVADSPVGPYTTLGPMLEPLMDVASWESGENGHASAFLDDHKLMLFYQARGKGSDAKWRYGVAEFSVTYDEPAA